VSCGAGLDTISADPVDTVDDDCERVTTVDPPVTSASDLEPDLPPDPEVEQGAESPPLVSGGAARRAGAGCAARGSRGWVRCFIRLVDPQAAGRLELTLVSGRKVIARGSGRVSGGQARMRMRIRDPLVAGEYRLRAVIRPSGHLRYARGFRVAVVPGR
jgi:hypothetical protein